MGLWSDDRPTAADYASAKADSLKRENDSLKERINQLENKVSELETWARGVALQLQAKR